jgi:hypothetical protein
VKEKILVPELNEALCLEDEWESGSIAIRIVTAGLGADEWESGSIAVRIVTAGLGADVFFF